VPFHLGFQLAGRLENLGLYVLNLDEETLRARFVEPYRMGETITWEGRWVPASEITRVTIYRTDDAINQAGDWPAFNVFASQGANVTNEYIDGPPGSAAPAPPPGPPDDARDPRRVMVVHGRNRTALNGVRAFLAALGLEPVLWEDAVEETDSASPYNLDAVKAAMAVAQVVIVIFTAEDEARLLPAFVSDDDGPDETELRGQPRSNVFLEAGMALAFDRDHTILVRIGSFRGASDVDGMNGIRMSNAVGPRTALRRRLRTADCAINDREDYLDPGVAGNFDEVAIAAGPGSEVPGSPAPDWE
jgi:predicted nucleotide-binding protein